MRIARIYPKTSESNSSVRQQSSIPQQQQQDQERQSSSIQQRRTAISIQPASSSELYYEKLRPHLQKCLQTYGSIDNITTLLNVIINVFREIRHQRSQSKDTCLDSVFHVLTTTHKTLIFDSLENQACILKIVEWLKQSEQKSGVMEVHMENSINPYLLALHFYHIQRRIMESYNSRKFEQALDILIQSVQDIIRILKQIGVKKQVARPFVGEFQKFWKDFLPQTFFRVWEAFGIMLYKRYNLAQLKYQPESRFLPNILSENKLRIFRNTGTVPHQDQFHMLTPVDMTLVEFENLISGRISRISNLLKSGIQNRRHPTRTRTSGFTLDEILSKVKRLF